MEPTGEIRKKIPHVFVLFIVSFLTSHRVCVLLVRQHNEFGHLEVLKQNWCVCNNAQHNIGQKVG